MFEEQREQDASMLLAVLGIVLLIALGFILVASIRTNYSVEHEDLKALKAWKFAVEDCERFLNEDRHMHKFCLETHNPEFVDKYYSSN